MCKVFPSRLKPVAMRWFDGLKEGSIRPLKELTRAFRVRFVTCSRVPRPLDSLLSMAMKEEETLKTYSNGYWETFNEIDGDFEDVAIRTFNIGLPVEHDLRKLLTKKPVRSICQLMDHINKHKRVEEDQTQRKGKVKVFPKKRDLLAGGYNHNRPMRDFPNQSSRTGTQMVNSVFKEPIYQILEKIKNEPYFK